MIIANILYCLWQIFKLTVIYPTLVGLVIILILLIILGNI